MMDQEGGVRFEELKLHGICLMFESGTATLLVACEGRSHPRLGNLAKLVNANDSNRTLPKSDTSEFVQPSSYP